MNVVQINDYDLPGRRFNGYDLQFVLNQRKISACQLVLANTGTEKAAVPLIHPSSMRLRNELIQFEQYLSMDSLVFPAGKLINENSEFKKADVVHYHLIHNYFLSLLDFPDLTALKPSVWTLHDPWAFTGHCVHPKECEGWKTGCSPCPHCDYYFPMKYDKAWQMWNIKKQVYAKLDIDVVVASGWMEQFVKTSPLTKHMEHVHRIPFGIQVENYGYTSKKQARSRWKVSETDFVIAFRAETTEFKGLPYILQMLSRLKSRQHVTLLTVGHAALPKKIKKIFQVIELGWQDDSKILSDFYSACDVFLMPSMAEAFGLMAIEAMASSRPVIVFEGTALPGITYAPKCGIAVPRGDSDALAVAVERLMNHPGECEKRGEKGREIAEREYRFEDYVNRHIKLYEQVIKRHQK